MAKAITAIDNCYHWAGEVGDQSAQRNKEILEGVERDCPDAELKARKAYELYPANALLATKILQLIDIHRFNASVEERKGICESASSVAAETFKKTKTEDVLFRAVCPDQAKNLYGK